MEKNMGFLVQNKTEQDSFLYFKGKEPFVDEWSLMSSPVPVLTIAASYLLFVLKIGPNYMKKRPPLDLNYVLILYNAVQVLMSCYMTAIGVHLLWQDGLIHKSCILKREIAEKIAGGMHIYLLAKISELLDTIFFVLRKKNDQLTFLHVYHHTIILICSWFTLKYEPTYSSVFLGTLNSCVHIIMYSYYGLSTVPRLKKYLWWKKYITSMQLVQFVLIILHVTANYVYSGCPPSYALLQAIVLNSAIFIYLFSNFYVKAYIKYQRDKRVLNNAQYVNEIRKCKKEKFSEIKRSVPKRVSASG